MLTSLQPTSGSNGAVKSLHENPSESKTPEVEMNHVQEAQPQPQSSSNLESDSKQEEEWAALPIESSLSTRASQMKSAINSQETVKAVVLSPDGSASEISYSSSSKQASKILSGRPTIIGQLEDIGVVVCRSLDQSNCGPANKSVLPAPLCNASYNGNYLLFAVDADGFSKDFSLGEYEKYGSEKKSETEQAQKEFDGKQIAIKSALSSSLSYDLTKVFIQSEIDRKSKADKISQAEAVSVLVSEFLSADSSPMNDPDYSPADETEVDESESADYESVSEGDWRTELEAVLPSIRERGHADGEYLAERISATFYELNGVEPSLNELRNVFASIEQDFANEAEEDEASEKNADAQRLAEQLASSLTDNPDPTELVEYSMQIVGMDLVSRAKAAYSSINGGQQPSKKALRRSVEKLAMKLAKDAVAGFAAEPQKSSAEVYDPTNIDDQILARYDEIEDEQFNEDHFNLKMLTTASKSKKGKYEAYDVYFSNFSKATEEANLAKAVASFEMRNRREPSGEEVDAIRAFLATNKQTQLVQFKLSVISDEQEEEAAEAKNEKLLVTPVKKKKSAARFSVFFDGKDKAEMSQNTETALKWFERFANRKPTKLEMSGIESFIQADKSELIECEFEVSAKAKAVHVFDDDSKEDEAQLLKMKTTQPVKKKTSTTYTLDFAEKSRESGDAKQALKWFERFNGRHASKEEMARISAFVKADNEQTIDID